MEELLARLRALQRRSPQLQPQQLTVGNLTLDYSTRTVCFQMIETLHGMGYRFNPTHESK
jgi:hypothetical protein